MSRVEQTDAGDERAELLRRRLSARGGRPAAVPVAGPRAERPVLSFGQRRIWFIDQLQPNSAAYTIPIAYRLTGEVHLGALHRALGTVIGRHEALRTRFAVWQDEPYQVVEADWPGLVLQDVSGDPDPGERARRVLAEEVSRPFDLATGPLFRARLLRLGRHDHVLVMAVHHSVFDGWSLGVLTDELSQAYAAFHAGGRPDLPELALQYADFAAWQHRHLTGERLAGHLAYWRERLAGAPEVIGLPTDRPRPPQPSFRGGAVPFRVPPETARALRALARDRSASLFMVTLAAYQALLSRHAVTTDVVVGVPVAGRDHRVLEGMIGFFAQTLPLRADLSADPTFAELLDQVRDGFLADSAHQELPFERLVEEVAPNRDVAHNPVVQVLFNLLTAETGAQPPRLPGLRVTEFGTDAATTRFDLELHLSDSGGDLDGRLVYAADLFDPIGMGWFVGHYLRLLDAVARDPSARVSRVPIVTDEERDLIARWNDESTRSTESEYV